MVDPPWRQVSRHRDPTTARTCSAVLYSRTYVQKILSKLPPAQLHLSTPIKALESVPVSDKTGQTHTVKLTTEAGETLEFDHVIMACHTDTTVDILNAGGGMSKEEARILEAFKWNRNEAVLHCDERVSLTVKQVHIAERTDSSLHS